MAQLKGYYDREQLEEMYYKGQITKAEILMHSDSNTLGRYRKFCKERNLNVNSSEAADSFMQMEIDEEQAHLEIPGSSLSSNVHNESNVDENNYAAQIFKKWNKNPEKIQSMLNSVEASKIALWRLLHPTDMDKDECAREMATDNATVEEWWDIPDYMLGSNDGYPISLVEYNMTSIAKALKNCVPENLR